MTDQKNPNPDAAPTGADIIRESDLRHRADILGAVAEDLIAAEARRFEDSVAADLAHAPQAAGPMERMAEPLGPKLIPVETWDPKTWPPAEGTCVQYDTPRGTVTVETPSSEPFFYPGEKDEAPAVAPASLEEMNDLSVGDSLIRRALAAEQRVAELEVENEAAHRKAADAEFDAAGREEWLQRNLDTAEAQLGFLSASLTRQFERVAGLRLYGGELSAPQVVPFVQTEVNAINSTLEAIRDAKAEK